MTAPDGDLHFRRATRADLDAIVAMLADDELGRARERPESPLPDSYVQAFDAIERNDDIELVVGCAGDQVVAVLQITFIPNISWQGSWRAAIEGVRTAAGLRGRGVGAALVRHAIERARERGCRIVQLDTDQRRVDARRFYERLGFKGTHIGMKLHL